ncbi:NUDIX hydrolase [Micromonospora tarapacensis]|uniref:NUDIX hydrolase n=1 Tax=Micromonospora tarapacensis TaxID=2835305 RepID=UPI002F3FCE35
MPEDSTADDRPLYERDPDAWHAHLAEGNAKQPRKRVGADVLIRNEQGHVLLVNPRYKPDWDLPGGMAEANEPPHLAAERELREELGIERLRNAASAHRTGNCRYLVNGMPPVR